MKVKAVLDLHVDLSCYGVHAATESLKGRPMMKTKLFGVVAALMALFGTSAAAATKLAGTGGCPLCR